MERGRGGEGRGENGLEKQFLIHMNGLEKQFWKKSDPKKTEKKNSKNLSEIAACEKIL